jgi:hypothetical protein
VLQHAEKRGISVKEETLETEKEKTDSDASE